MTTVTQVVSAMDSRRELLVSLKQCFKDADAPVAVDSNESAPENAEADATVRAVDLEHEIFCKSGGDLSSYRCAAQKALVRLGSSTKLQIPEETAEAASSFPPSASRHHGGCHCLCC